MVKYNKNYLSQYWFTYSILSAWLCSSVQAGINLCVCASQRKMTENFRNSVIILSRTLQRQSARLEIVYALSTKYVGCSTDRHALGDGGLWISPKSSLGHDTFICIKLDGRKCALFLPLDIGADKSHRCKVRLAGLNMTQVVIWGSPSRRCRLHRLPATHYCWLFLVFLWLFQRGQSNRSFNLL